jgi:polysaccharide chain length determinant protein (PEP-CTERM system associated)
MQVQVNEMLGYFKSIWIKRRYILICTWLICPIGWLVVTMVPYKYESSARVNVDTQSILAPLLEGMTVEVDSDLKVNLMVKTLLSRNNLERIVRMTDLDLQASTSREFEKIIKDLREDFTVDKKRRDNIYTFAIANEDPVLAKNIVEAALSVFIDNTMTDNLNDTNNAKKFINEKVKEYKDRLTKSEHKIAKFKQAHTYELPNQVGGYYEMLYIEKQKVADANLARQMLNSELKIAKRNLYDNPQSIALSSDYDERIKALQKGIDDLLVVYTPIHPKVKVSKIRIKALQSAKQDEIRSFNKLTDEEKAKNIKIDSVSETTKEYHMSLASLETKASAELVKLNIHKKRVLELESRIHLIPDIEAKMTSLTRDYDINKDQYEKLLSTRETARLAEDVEQKTEKIQFDILDPPRVAIKPNGPGRALLYLAVAIVGVGSGVGLSFLLGQLFPVAMSLQQITKDTGMTVYGVIDASPNCSLRTVERKKNIVFLLSNSVFILCLIALISFSLREQILIIFNKVL